MVHILRYIKENRTLGLEYYAIINDEPVSDLFRKARIKTENKLMAFSDSIWQDYPHNGTITVSYIIFNQGCKIDHSTHVIGPVAQSSAESEYNAALQERI